jgi:hypothetical protein
VSAVGPVGCYRRYDRPGSTERGARMHARLVTSLRNAVVLLASFFLLAVG